MKPFIAAAVLLCSLVFARAANPSGSGTNNLVPKWTGSLTLGSSTITNTASAIGLGNGSLVGTTLSGTTSVIAGGDAALQSSSITNSDSIFVIGAFSSLGASNLSGLYSIGGYSGGSSQFKDSGDVVLIGNSHFSSASVSNSFDLFGIGHSVFNSTTLQSDNDLFAAGHTALSGAIITNAQEIYGFGYAALFQSRITNSSQLYAFANSALEQAVVNASTEVYALGSSALDSSTLTNVSDIYAIGSSAGNTLSLNGKSHIFMLGSGAMATNSNDYVFGDSAYNYFFPGAGASFANYVRLSGNTNRYTDSGTALLRNGVAVGGTTVSVNGTNVTTPNFTNSATVTLAVSGSNITATAIVPAGTASASGTANLVAKFTSTTNLGNSSITDNGTSVTMTEPLLFSADNTFDIGASNATRPRFLWAGTSVRAPIGSVTAPSFAFDAGTNTGFYSPVLPTIRVVQNGADAYSFGSSSFIIGNTLTLAFASSGVGTTDTFLSRASAGMLRINTNLMVSGQTTLSNLTGTATILAGITSSNTVAGVGIGTGLAMSGTNLTATATGETTATNIVTLTMTTTNVSAMDYSLVQRGGVFKLALTGNGYIGAPSGVANTAFTHAWLMVQQPSTGTCALTFTNGFYAFPEGIAPIIDTNNGAVTVFEFTSDVFTNGLLHGWMSVKSKLIP